MAKRYVILSKGCIVVGSSPTPITNEKYNKINNDDYHNNHLNIL